MAVEAHNAPTEGALTLDQAAGLLGEMAEREDDAPAPEPAEPEPEHHEPTPEGEGGEEPDEANPADAEPEPEPEPEGPEIEPPLFWDAEAKETFKTLPRDLQQKLAEQAETISKAV
jgi:hypothetical protein